MIYIRTDGFGGRHISMGEDGKEHGDEMVDQLLAIFMGWGIAIDEASK